MAIKAIINRDLVSNDGIINNASGMQKDQVTIDDLIREPNKYISQYRVFYKNADEIEKSLSSARVLRKGKDIVASVSSEGVFFTNTAKKSRIEKRKAQLAQLKADRTAFEKELEAKEAARKAANAKAQAEKASTKIVAAKATAKSTTAAKKTTASTKATTAKK